MADLCNGTTRERVYLPFQIDHIPDSIVTRAEKELGETEEVRARTFYEMRKLISREPNFTCPTGDDYLLMFLRSRKFDVHRAFKLLQAAWGVKRKFENLFGTYNEESLMRTFGLKCVFCLPYRDKDGAAIYILKMRNWDPDVSTADELITTLTMALHSCIQYPVTQICGIRLLIDVGGMYLKQGRHLTPTSLRIMTNALKSTFPARFVGIHYYDGSAIFSTLWIILKRFLSVKLRSRIHFHGSRDEELLNFFPKEVLPVEYGGENKDDVVAWYITDVAENFLDRYKALLLYGYTK